MQYGVCRFVAIYVNIKVLRKFNERFISVSGSIFDYIIYGVRPLPLPKTSVTKHLPMRLVNADWETVVQSQ